MRTGRPKADLTLTVDEIRQLRHLACETSVDGQAALRSRIILQCAAGLTNRDVARRLDISEGTVGKWRARFIEHRLTCLETSEPWSNPYPGGRPKAELVLTAHEREVLERLAQRDSAADQLALRSRVILASTEGSTNRQVAREHSIAEHTVGRWRARFLEQRLKGIGATGESRPPLAAAE
ncbi:helix-turn-helix domain-containing protein [Streptomyces sp. NPDC096057]|uniref:helix-turn-helix domain-containing protein n=1 Tax=Streptomyces sp. NPDC096057 TaxID=3155543 RepID=UPI003316808C